MLTLGGIAVAIMVVILLAAVQGAVAAAAAARGPRRRRLGVRARGLPRHPAHDRHHRRPAGDARHRHRLRDPDARARRGGGGHRPRRAPDPGDRAQPRAGAARRDVRRDLRVRRAALRQGADDPRLRAAARGRHRGDLPLLDHPAARDPRHPRVPLAHQGPGLPRGPARPARRVARQRPGRFADPARDRERRDLRRRHRGRGQAHAADRPGAVGQPEVQSHQGHPRGRGRDGRVERARRVRPERRRVLRRVRHVRARLHPRQLATQNGKLLTGSSIETAIGDIIDDVPGRDRHRADG